MILNTHFLQTLNAFIYSILHTPWILGQRFIC